MSKSVFKDIKGYEDCYYCSSDGKIFSKERLVRSLSHGSECQRLIEGKEITPINHGNGYLYVSLSKGGRRKNFYVHRLIAEAFIGNADGLVINHKNFIRADNRVENLEIVTQLENIQYSVPNMCRPRRRHKLSATGYKYIYFRCGKYRVSIVRNHRIVLDKCFDSLEEAIKARDEVMKRDEKYYAK